MSKIITESLNEFREFREVRDSKKDSKEVLNEAIQPGRTFRERFLKATHSLVKAGKVDKAESLYKWAKKLKNLGWPREMALKKALGDKVFNSFIKLVLPYTIKQVPSFAADVGGGTASRKGGDIGKDDATRLSVVAGALGISEDELKGIIIKTK